MTEKERLLKKLEGVRALAQRGVGGEKQNAERILADLMDRYGITDADLEEDREETYFIRYSTTYERRLLHQLAYMHLGPGHSGGCVGTYTNRPRKKVAITCTPAAYIEIEADYEFYRKALVDDLDLLYSAFLTKNDLFPPPELAGEPGSDDEIDIERSTKIALISESLDRRQRHKALPPEE